MALQRHQAVANTLMERIFRRTILPGEKLPTEKNLSKELNVDRSSLRVALKMLESLGVLDIRQGDGMYVLDYLKSGGIDFLRLLFSSEGLNHSKALFDQYLADELMEVWMFIFPGMMRVCAERLSTRHVQALMELLDQELTCLDDREKFVSLEIAEQDLVAKVVDNTVLLLLFNSVRPLRKIMTRTFVFHVEKETLKQHNQVKQDLLNAVVSGSRQEAEQAMDRFMQNLKDFRQVIRKSWSDKKHATK